MGKKSKDSSQEPVTVLQSLFSTDNPFRRKPQPESPAAPPPAELGLGERKPNVVSVDLKEERKKIRNAEQEKPDSNGSSKAISKKLKELELREEDAQSLRQQKKRINRDEIEQEYERKRYGAEAQNEDESDGEERRVVAVGEKRKADDVIAADMVVSKEESFDDETKLLRTVFVGNLSLKTKRKALLKEFAKFGEVESVRIRSVPLLDSKLPRKGAIMKGKINDAVDCVHAYIVFKDEQSAKAALSHNMSLFGENHIRVDMACPPRNKLKGEGPLYDRKRTVFVGNLPFDIKDEELYQLFCGDNQSASSMEAIRVIRDPNTSLGKGIAYVLFKTREAANSIVKQKDLKIRDRILRVCHAKSADATPSKRKSNELEKGTPKKKFAATNRQPSSRNDKPKPSAASLSYQGVRASKSGVLKKSNLQRQVHKQRNQKSTEAEGKYNKQMNRKSTQDDARKNKRPAVAARKAKELAKKRKQEYATPENTHRNKKAENTHRNKKARRE